MTNESSETIRMFNTAFNGLGATPRDHYPAALRAQIDEANARAHDTVNGVYKSDFATTAEAYLEAVRPLFDTLDWLEARLEKQRFLVGNALTEADIHVRTGSGRRTPVTSAPIVSTSLAI
ncbi:hypothetical protein CI15_18570 [Paraburkholderia monticola]|uniref:Glutathione S-transferase C-terminal domain-containing protein n=1 Tax=Paraburkholderia monticola TaxID=1399968 RepID=A0A149PN22_9BURK|nr:hypothetical protein CI15_18570 [Paraburkholderia monticola]